ncbi:HD-GYP domain-containing protein [Paenibacillus sp. IB182496]|uniref:HD-GYP domain-containing protein n=1 Tax=Paenibacillus sabuli TaxID=2772509 RepID=A0A927BY59_9BACL|nr:HD-GYP domain-containing protein [Paenibacillus sabuli]MBD2847569.1 HD-GYP domain-containing protein [Paenibacillus sabuli]
MNETSLLGRTLTRSIYTRQGGLLLPWGRSIGAEEMAALRRHGIDLWEEDVELAAAACMDELVGEVENLFARLAAASEGYTIGAIRRRIVPRVQRLYDHLRLPALLQLLCRKDRDTYRHSVGVALLSCLIGRWLGHSRAQQQELLVAGLLHDLGKTRISDEILQKAGRLTPEEYLEMQRHARLGYEMIRAMPEAGERLALAALQHHEREDGSGYPSGLTGDAILETSKIVAVADVFHAMISARAYKQPLPLYQVLQRLERGAYGSFEPAAVHALVHQVMTGLIGEQVVLEDGRLARIVLLHPDDLTNPLVASDGVYYDLRRHPFKIKETLSLK